MATHGHEGGGALNDDQRGGHHERQPLPKDTVQKAFDELAAIAFDKRISETQYTETRRVFFAGVLWAINEVERRSAYPDDPTGERAYRELEAMRLECQTFGQLVKEGLR